MPLKRIGATATPPVHRFSAIQGPLRDDWFGQIETKFDWIELGPIGEGESQSLRVRNNGNDMEGAAKPGPTKAGEDKHCRAAHEKLAFDLSCLTALPVCPVVLWKEGL